MIADRPQAARKSLRIDLPSADVRPAPLVPIPAGIHPPVIQFQAFFQVAIDEQFLAGRIGVDHFTELMGAARGELHGRQLAAGPRQVMRDHPAPPRVLGANVIVLPKLQHDQRRTHFLAWM